MGIDYLVEFGYTRTNKTAPLGAERTRKGGPVALLTAKELAVELSVHPNTIKEWCRRGLIPVERIGRVLRFDLLEVRSEMRRRAAVTTK